MLTLKRILTPVDLLAASGQALREAYALAERFEATLYVLNVTVPDPTIEPGTWTEALRVWIQKTLALPLPENKDGPCIKPVTIQGAMVGPTILRYAAQSEMDLIVMGTHQREGVERTLPGSIAEEVVRHAPCPVLTFQRPILTERLPFAPRRILVPTDFSDCSQHALMHAKELAASFGARLSLLHVLQHRTLLHAHQNPRLRNVLEDSMRPSFLEKHLHTLFEEVPGPEVPVDYHVVTGTAGQRISAFARTREMDLIVMSSHGLTGVRYFLMGSVTQQVVRLAPCPVFAVQAFKHSLVQATPSTFKQPLVTSFTSMLHEQLLNALASDQEGSSPEGVLPPFPSAITERSAMGSRRSDPPGTRPNVPSSSDSRP